MNSREKRIAVQSEEAHPAEGERACRGKDSEGGSVRCPSCDSPTPRMRPSIRHEGEIQTCADPFHEAHPQKENAPVVEPWIVELTHAITRINPCSISTEQKIAELVASACEAERSQLQAKIEAADRLAAITVAPEINHHWRSEIAEAARAYIAARDKKEL